MARIAKILKIEGRKEYTIKELKNSHSKQIILMIKEMEDINSFDSLTAFFSQNLKKILEWVSNIPIEDFEDFSHSETAQVWEMFKSINPFFLQTIKLLKVKENLGRMTNLGWEGFMMGYARSLQNLSETDTQKPGITDGTSPK